MLQLLNKCFQVCHLPAARFLSLSNLRKNFLFLPATFNQLYLRSFSGDVRHETKSTPAFQKWGQSPCCMRKARVCNAFSCIIYFAGKYLNLLRNKLKLLSGLPVLHESKTWRWCRISLGQMCPCWRHRWGILKYTTKLQHLQTGHLVMLRPHQSSNFTRLPSSRMVVVL